MPLSTRARTPSPTFLFLPLHLSNSAVKPNNNPATQQKTGSRTLKAAMATFNPVKMPKTGRAAKQIGRAPSSMTLIYEQPAPLSTRSLDFFDAPVTLSQARPVDNFDGLRPKSL